ncbi:MAG: nucleotidyltransferase family protein [Rhodospirillaceae bacterium]|nr:MAG: nucleotidyltransferase family protein [Rhodospirillaceae bacterium]
MLLAAGLGTRMRPITERMPKPLVPVAGKALIDWTLDPLAASGVTRAVVNVHHLAEQMRNHLGTRTRPAIAISDESAALLDTGGGIVKALPLLGPDPFFVCNCDGIIVDAPGQPSAFRKLAAAWNPEKLDVIMLVHPLETAHGFDGPGDFFVASDGVMSRRHTAARAPFVYAGAWIVHPRAFAGEQAIPFSANRIWDRAIAAGRMIAVVNDGDWYHVGTPEAVPATTALLAGTAP